MKKVVFIVLASFNMAVLMAQDSTGNTIEVEITDIDSDDGKMMIGLYDSEENWLNKPVMAQIGKIKNRKSIVVFENVPNGVFALSTFHDENGDGKLDTNFLGIPKEDTGASNNAPANFGPPKWADAKFELKGKSIKQSIEL